MNDDGHVVFDKDRLMAALRSGLDLNDCTPEDIEDLKPNPDVQSFANERLEELYDEQNTEDSTYDLAALGASRKIGDLDFMCTLGNIVLLNNINSPLVSGELGSEVDFEDVVKALYILYYGKEALTPIMNIKEKIQDLFILKPLCKDNPEMCDRVIKKYEEITSARTVFTEKAIEFYETHFLGSDLQDVFDKMFSMIDDVIKGVEEVHTEAESGSGPAAKKNL